jgi:hypothetical protein
MAFFPSSSRAESSVFFVLPVTSTRAPWSSSSFAVAGPMPLVPPVITTRLPSYCPMVAFSIVRPKSCLVLIHGSCGTARSVSANFEPIRKIIEGRKDIVN